MNEAKSLIGKRLEGTSENLYSDPLWAPDIGVEPRTETIYHDGVKRFTVFYKNGHVEKTIPGLQNYYEERDVIYGATDIISDGVKYDLTDKASVARIRVPDYDCSPLNRIGQALGVTGTLDYTLRMRAGLFWNEKKFDLAICCLEKATIMMPYSDNMWPKRDYYRIVNELRDLGYLSRANQWKEWIEKIVKDPAEDVFNKCLRECKEVGTDLVEVGDSGVCCEKCAKYRKRIYSLSGHDIRFPKFPKDFHTDCGLSVYPFFYGINEPSFECKNVVLYSRRPFRDDRTREEIANREKWLTDIAKSQNYERAPDVGRITYYRLCQLLPDDVPKTVSGFMRMRNVKSKRYQELVRKAEEIGFAFPQSIEEVELQG